MAVNGFLVNDEVQKYNYESLENYNTPDFSTSSTYQVGDYVMYQGKLYRCTTEIITSGGWDSSKWNLAILSDDVANLKKSVESGEYGLSELIKQAILQIARKVVYVDDQGQTYYDDLYDALYPINNIVSISAVFTQGSNIVYTTDSLESLEQYLVVTAIYDDSSSEEVSNYTLSGTLSAGTSTITVSYSGFTTTFTVDVTQAMVPASYRQVEYLYGNGNAHITMSNKQIALNNVMHVIAEQVEADTGANRIVCGGGNQTVYIGMATFFSDGAVGANYGLTQSKVTLQTPHGTPVEFSNKITSSAIVVSATSNGETQTHSESKTNMAGSNTGFKLFWNGSTSTIFAGRIYFAELLNGSSPIVQLYPCVRKSDNQTGFYDTVGNSFYPSETGTDFTIE